MEKITQGTPQWLDYKQKTIGGSEIYTLVYHYCRPELEAMGFTSEELAKDRPFRTVQELFLKVKFGAELSEIEPIHKVFGNKLEEYIARRLEKEIPQISIERTKEFITTESLASCSPDGYLAIKEGVLDDYDKKVKIDASWGRGMAELKTANYFSKFSSGGSRLQYIMQDQHNMMICGLKWGLLTAFRPKDKEIEIDGVKFPVDDPFIKGQAYVYANQENFQFLDENYDLDHYIYPALPAFQAMIMKSLNAFQAALDGYDTDQSLFPRNSEDLVGLQREKKMWAQLWPEHYGEKQLEETDELDKLFNERYQAQVEKMFVEQHQESLTNEICQKVKAAGFDKFTEIIGTQNRMFFTKNGQIRFFKLKTKNEGK